MNLENALDMKSYHIDAEIGELIKPLKGIVNNGYDKYLGYLLNQYFFHYNFLLRITGFVKTEKEKFSDFHNLFMTKREELMIGKLQNKLEDLEKLNQLKKFDKGLILIGEYHFDHMKQLLEEKFISK